MMQTTPVYDAACRELKDVWVAAHGGMEDPFTTKTGRRLQYVYNPSSGRHAYYDVRADLILTNDEAFEALGI